MYASHSWPVWPHSIVQSKNTPLFYAVLHNKSAQAPAIVNCLLKRKADVDARDGVSAWDRGMLWGTICLAC